MKERTKEWNERNAISKVRTGLISQREREREREVRSVLNGLAVVRCAFVVSVERKREREREKEREAITLI
jgi:hypothetical protein